MDVIDAKWIRERLLGTRGEQSRLAEAMGIDNDKMSKVLKGKRRVQPEEIPKVLEFFDEARPERSDPGEEAPNKALVPVYDVAASAGHGAVADYEPQTHSLAFPPDYLKRLTSSSPKNLAIISVKGESMEPTLLDDDIVLLDSSKTNLSYDGLFVIRFDDALHVKRVGRSAKSGHITIISDNRDLYPPIEASADDVKAVGKVLWYGRKV